MTFKVNISIENNETKSKTEYEIPIVQNLDVEQRRLNPLSLPWDMMFRFQALPYDDRGTRMMAVLPEKMDPRTRIEMLEERKAEIDKEIQAITDSQWSWKKS